MKYLLLLMCFTFSQSKGQHCCSVFSYANYTDTNVVLPLGYEVDMPKYNYYRGLLLSNANMEYRAFGSKPLDEKWIHFFAEQDIVNGWAHFSEEDKKQYDETREKTINRFIGDDTTMTLTIKCISRYLYSNNFRSYIFVIERKGDFLLDIRDLYLLNIRDGIVLSIGKVGSYYSDNGQFDITYSFGENNVFHYINEEISSDVVLCCEELEEAIGIFESTSASKFKLDTLTGEFRIVR